MNSITVVFYKQWHLKRSSKTEKLSDFLQEVFKENIILTDKIESLFYVRSNKDYAWYVFDLKTYQPLSLTSMSNQILVIYTSCAEFKHFSLEIFPKGIIKKSDKIKNVSEINLPFPIFKRQLSKLKITKKIPIIVKKLAYRNLSEKRISKKRKIWKQNYHKQALVDDKRISKTPVYLIKRYPKIIVFSWKKNRKSNKRFKYKPKKIKKIRTIFQKKKVRKKVYLQHSLWISPLVKRNRIPTIKKSNYLALKRNNHLVKSVLPLKRASKVILPSPVYHKNYRKLIKVERRNLKVFSLNQKARVSRLKVVKNSTPKNVTNFRVKKNPRSQNKINQITPIQKNDSIKTKTVMVKKRQKSTVKLYIKDIENKKAQDILPFQPNKINSMVIFPDGQVLGNICIENTRKVTAEQLLLLSGLSVTYNQGFITSINGMCNVGMSGWIFEVNHTPIMISAKDYMVQPNDHITWRYIDFSKINQPSIENKPQQRKEKRMIFTKPNSSLSKK